jgi:two-component system sensor histidine kinase/response regulator
MPCPECGHVPLEHAESWVSIGDAGEHVYFLERIEHSGNQLLGVINDLLDISHLESGRTQLCLEEVHLRDVLAQVRETIEPWARRKEHAVTWPELEGDIVIRADGSKLVQMLGHLLSNAVKFTGRGGRITLSVAPCDLGDRKAVGMTVRDTGEGIASNALKTIFDAFRMADGSHTRSHPGTGLGLAITHHLVHLHHGNIVVRSKLDEGSAFTLILPVQGPEPEEEVDGPA